MRDNPGGSRVSEKKLGCKHILGIEGLEVEEIDHILNTAESMKEISERRIKKVPTLRGLTVVNLFYEPSTRTKSSFGIAEKRLSADSMNFSKSTSSIKKGETLRDTALNLEAMKPDIIVIRHQSPGAPHFLSKICEASIINAGDGAHEHPTQALLDALTIREKKGNFEDLEITIVGDITHSRVARSNILLLSKMGANVTVCGPKTLLPVEIENMDVNVETSFDKAIEDRDVIMMLRIQLERQKTCYFPSVREYFRFYGLTEERVKKAEDDVIIMHPGPMNRGVEIASSVADGPYSVILNQVTNGVAVRMALLYLLLGGTSDELTD